MKKVTSMEFEGKSLSDEQLAIVNSFNSGTNLLVSARAGTSKSFTMLACASQSPRKGLFLSFNKRDAESSSKRAKDIRNVSVKTIDSFIYEMYRAHQSNSAKVCFKLYSYSQWASISGFVETEKMFNYKDKSIRVKIAPYHAGTLLDEMVRAIIITPELEESTSALKARASDPISFIASRLAYGHRYKFVKNKQLDEPAYKDFKKDVTDFVKSALIRQIYKAKSVAARLISQAHSNSLKLLTLELMARVVYDNHVQISKFGYDYVIVDEFQDVSMVVLNLLNDQKDIQVVAVGDDRQEIYKWRGANAAMDKFEYSSKLELNIAYRYSKTIAERAKVIINAEINAVKPENPDTFNMDTQKVDLNAIDIVLAQTNDILLGAALILLENGQHPKIAKESASIAKGFLDDYVSRKLGNYDWKNRFHCLKNSEFDEFIFKGVEGAIVKFISNDKRVIVPERLSILLESLDNSVKSTKGKKCVELRTIHTSKGGEWDNTLVLYKPNANPKAERDHQNLMYVAITRAKKVCNHIEALDFFGYHDLEY